eukprot:3640614-Rhodomonas_salina.2
MAAYAGSVPGFAYHARSIIREHHELLQYCSTAIELRVGTYSSTIHCFSTAMQLSSYVYGLKSPIVLYEHRARTIRCSSVPGTA